MRIDFAINMLIFLIWHWLSEGDSPFGNLRIAAPLSLYFMCRGGGVSCSLPMTKL
jgi:hypothetical protein